MEKSYSTEYLKTYEWPDEIKDPEGDVREVTPLELQLLDTCFKAIVNHNALVDQLKE